MPATPPNQPLSRQTAKPAPAPAQPEGAPTPADYPKVLYHKDSTVGNLLGKQVNDAEEEKALGGEYVPLSELDLETAPAEAKPEPKADKDE
jgi:hypothetical protein